MAKDKCKWKPMVDEGYDYNTACGFAYTISDGTPEENGMIYCCFCGREIEVENG